jgi:hypothetical protein
MNEPTVIIVAINTNAIGKSTLKENRQCEFVLDKLGIYKTPFPKATIEQVD